MSITTVIKAIQDIMRKDAGVDGDAQRITQLGWMLFLKIFDDREKEYETLDPEYRSVVPGEFRWRNWAADPEGITGDDLLDFINRLFRALRNLQFATTGDPRGFAVRDAFADVNNYMTSGTLIRQVVNKLNEIDFNRKDDRHLFNDIYEKILKDLQSAGNAGEFYTPRALTEFMVEMTDPKLGENLLDPACGTGGFLTCAIDHIRSNYVETTEDEATLQASIHGVEKKGLPHLLCTTNMLLHGIENPALIRHDNTLRKPLRNYGPADRVNVVVTNPPFGGTEEDGIESGFPKTFRTRETADLFLVLIMKVLKDGGRCAMVLPDGTLFGKGVKTRIKEKLLRDCNLHTIVRLPNGVFNPYTGIKTNLLFFEKGKPTEEVWYYEHPYPEGYKSYSKTKPIRIQEFRKLEKKWWNKREENEHAWRVPVQQIIDSGYNLDIKNPNTPEEDRGDPDELLTDYLELLKETAVARDALKAQLADALERHE